MERVKKSVRPPGAGREVGEAGGRLPAATGLTAASPVHSGSCRPRALWELSQKSAFPLWWPPPRQELRVSVFPGVWGALCAVRRPPAAPGRPRAFSSWARTLASGPASGWRGLGAAGWVRGPLAATGSTRGPVLADPGRRRAFRQEISGRPASRGPGLCFLPL